MYYYTTTVTVVFILILYHTSYIYVGNDDDDDHMKDHNYEGNTLSPLPNFEGGAACCAVSPLPTDFQGKLLSDVGISTHMINENHIHFEQQELPPSPASPTGDRVLNNNNDNGNFRTSSASGGSNNTLSNFTSFRTNTLFTSIFRSKSVQEGETSYTHIKNRASEPIINNIFTTTNAIANTNTNINTSTTNNNTIMNSQQLILNTSSTSSKKSNPTESRTTRVNQRRRSSLKSFSISNMFTKTSPSPSHSHGQSHSLTRSFPSTNRNTTPSFNNNNNSNATSFRHSFLSPLPTQNSLEIPIQGTKRHASERPWTHRVSYCIYYILFYLLLYIALICSIY